MAQIEFKKEELEELIKIKNPQEVLTNLGFPTEIEGDLYKVEVTPNRPDCLCVEGIARVLKQYKNGPSKFKVYKSNVEVFVQDSVKEVRPYFGGAVIRNIKMTESLIKSIIQIQEKLHETLGRKRKKVAIGLHDLKKVQPPFTYFACKKDEISFVPLEKQEKMTPGEILEKHPKGIMYKHLISNLCPMIIDKNNEVLSFPPIINGELTKITQDTMDIFIDTTGTSKQAISQTVNILCAMLAQRGGRIEEIKINGKYYPLLKETKWKIPYSKANKLLGISLSKQKIKQLLAKMGHRIVGNTAYVPGYRTDIMNSVDLIEDIAIAYGYNNFVPELPEIFTIGKTSLESPYHSLLIGLGFQEVLTWNLSNKNLIKKAKIEEEILEIENPLTEEFSIFRPALLPNLLSILAEGKKEKLPIKIYEIGRIAKGKKLEMHLALASMHSKASFSEVKGIVLSLLKTVQLKEGNFGPFVKGRCAEVYLEGKKIGYFGEIDPEVLDVFGLEQPVAAAEIII